MPTIKAKMIYTGTGIQLDGAVSWKGKTLVSPDVAAKDIIAEYPVITPAFIDAHCHIGLVRAGEPSDESEANDQMSAMLPHADVLDSIQMDDKGFYDSIESGVVYSCIVPGSGNIISGKSAVIRNYASNTNQAFICRAGIKAAFGYNPMHVRAWKGTRPYTRMGALAMLRDALVSVQNKMAKPDQSDVVYSAEEAVYRELLEGRDRLRVHVHKADDVAALLRLADTFQLKITVEHTCDIHEEQTYATLRDHGIAVIYGPMDSLAYKVELKHENWTNIRYLINSGVEFGLMTDHPVILQRNLLLTLRWFLRAGLSKQEALEIITRKNANILGIGDLLGTLDEGKWASFVCWNGDPFALGSYPVAVYAEGELIYQDS